MKCIRLWLKQFARNLNTPVSIQQMNVTKNMHALLNIAVIWLAIDMSGLWHIYHIKWSNHKLSGAGVQPVERRTPKHLYKNTQRETSPSEVQGVWARRWSSLQTLFTDFDCRIKRSKFENFVQFASWFVTSMFYVGRWATSWGLSQLSPCLALPLAVTL